MAGESILPLAARIDVGAGKLVSAKGVLDFADGYQSFVVEFGDFIEAEKPLPAPEITLYSQRDPRWAKEVYAGGTTFEAAGCYSVAYAMIASLAGYTDTPPECAAKLREAGCFVGNELVHPENGLSVYSRLRYDGRHDWTKVAADLSVVYSELRKGPMIVMVDFKPSTAVVDRHFVVALEYDEVKEDILIADPWDGKLAHLVERYALLWYAHGKTVQAAICGLRLLRPDDGEK